MWKDVPDIENMSDEDVAFLRWLYTRTPPEDIPAIRQAFQEEYNVEAPEWVRL